MRKAPFSFPDFVQKRYFTVDNVQPIVDRFGCKDSPESLACTLNDAAGGFDLNKDISTPAVGKKARAFFRGMARSMEGSKEWIEALGWEMANVEKVVTMFGPPINWQKFKGQLDQLGYAAKYREKQIPHKSTRLPTTPNLL